MAHFLHAEFWQLCSGLLSELVQEIPDHNGFEASRYVLKEMEKGTLNGKLAIVEHLN